VQEKFDGRRTTILTDEHGGMVGTIAELGLMLVFAAGAGERFDARLAVRAVQPAAARSKLELRECRRLLDGVDRGEQSWRIHAIARLSWRSGCGSKNFSHVPLSFLPRLRHFSD
jgi:hypothetical protein